MRDVFLQYLRCPVTGERLVLGLDAEREGDRVRTGSLVTAGCGRTYPIVNFIPRFVSSDNYAQSFGFQWNLHSTTQQEAHSSVAKSRRRFFETTGWETNLTGELVLEVGGGAGRFTEHALSAGATVISCDYSSAVEANHRINGWRDDLLIVQADLYALPFPPGLFDRVYCLGVLQHTPRPAEAFRCVAQVVRPTGALAIDVYKKTPFTYLHQTKYWVRPLTRRMPPERLYRLVVAYVDLMWPVARIIRRIPKLGRRINWRLLLADHSDLGLPEAQLKQWCYLDTFDMLSPRFDQPQRLTKVRRWFEEAGFQDFEVRYGWNGIEGRGKRGSGEGKVLESPPAATVP